MAETVGSAALGRWLRAFSDAVTENADMDRLGERLHGLHSTLIATNLTDAERAELLEILG